MSWLWLLACSDPVRPSAPLEVPAPSACAAPVERVVLVVIDTLRADAVAPELAAFADQSAVFTQAAALSSWTRPAVTTLMTGLSPDAHRNGYLFSRLSQEAVTAPERYREAGWEAWGAFGNVMLRGSIAQGLDPWTEVAAGPLEPSRTEELVQGVLAGLGDRELVYVHTIGPHEPYTPSAASAEKTGALLEGDLFDRQARDELEDKDPLTAHELDQLARLYAAEVLDEAAALGPLLTDPRLAESLVIVTSDHGQALGDHGLLTHGSGPFAAQIHVPLMIRGPGVVPGLRGELVSHLDVHSTLLAAAGIGEGRDLRCPVEDAPFLNLLDFHPDPERGVSFRARIEGQAKAVEAPKGKPVMYEDWRLDQREHRIARDPRIARMLSAARPAARPGLSFQAEPDEEARQRLRALGYLE